MWCGTCKAADQEQPLVMLEKLLPVQYSHTVCSYETTGGVGFRAAIKLKLSTEEEANRWLKDFEISSGFTWRKAKTYPNVWRYNRYRVDYRCHHNTCGYVSRKTNKSTFCPATLFLILKRQPGCGERKSRSGDPHMKEGLFLHVNLRNEHNHPAEAMTVGDVLGETVEKLKNLLESSHSPSLAFDVLQYDLQEEILNPPATGEPHLKERLNSMFLDLAKKLDNPDFTHSISSFLRTYENIKTDTAMVSALSSFGKPFQTKAKGCRRGRLQTSTQAGVQGKRRALSSGRPPKVSRKEKTNGRTEGKPSVAHSITHCVEEGACLWGETNS